MAADISNSNAHICAYCKERPACYTLTMLDGIATLHEILVYVCGPCMQALYERVPQHPE